MTIQAPRHVERLPLPRQVHFLNRAVARVAANALFDVDGVVKVHKIGDVIDLFPAQRRAGFVARPNRIQHGAVRPDLAVARHTHFGRRNRGVRLVFHRHVAVPAVDSKLLCMVLVTKGHRLIQGVELLGIGRASRDLTPDEDGGHGQAGPHHEADRHERIRSGLKQLGHCLS